jgi:hypothetical protein
MTNIQEAKEALLPTTQWVDAIQQNTISKEYYHIIISQSITLQSHNLSWLL